MDRKFWLEKWATNKIGFHQPTYNARLLEYWHILEAPAGSRVFVPLCGKSKDMVWLAEQGFEVMGIELSKLAVEAFFEARGETPVVSYHDALALHAGPTASIYLGDLFDLTAPHIKDVTACYDRGSLVALPPAMRPSYVDHLLRVLDDGVRILLLAVEYDQSLVSGPPHSVPESEVRSLYGERCTVELLKSDSTDVVPPHFAEQGMARVTETTYLITKQE